MEWNVDHQGAPGSELYFLRARYYDPETGRFLGQDPLPAGNLYAYVGNNPLRYTDPSGLTPSESSDECNGTGTVEVSTSVQGFAFGAVGEVGLGVGGDDSGTVGGIAFAGGGGGAAVPPAGLSWNILNLTLTNAGCLGARSGAGGEVGGCVWFVIGGCLSFVGQKGVSGIQISVGVGTPRVSFWGLITGTQVVTVDPVDAAGHLLGTINPFGWP